VVADALAAISFVILTAFLTAILYSFIRGINLQQGKMMRKVRKLRNHVIIAPFNSFSEALMDELDKKDVQGVIITDSERSARHLYAHNRLAVAGSANNIELLNAVGLHRALAVVLCSDNPTDNALAAVTVKTMNKRVRIIARVNKEEDLPKLSKAGVHMVILPEVAAGTWLGSVIAEKVLK
jgi:voltage-gated potassium channel